MRHPEFFTQPQLDLTKEMCAVKLDLDNFFHQLESAKHFWPYFEHPPVKTNGKVTWPRYRVFPMGWSNSVALAMAIKGDIITQDAELDPAMDLTANLSARIGRCRYGCSIDGIFVLGTCNKTTTKVCRIYL